MIGYRINRFQTNILPDFSSTVTKIPGVHRILRTYVFAVVVWAVWMALLLLFSQLATHVIPLNTEYALKLVPYRTGLPYLVWIWGNFDGVHYITIADNGYGQYQHPIFPLFPLMIRLVHTITSFHIVVSGIIIAHISMIAGLFVSKKLHDQDNRSSTFPLFVALVFLYPVSFYYAAVYTDGLFFLFTTLTILFARRQQFAASSVFAFLSSLTRFNGIALFAYVLTEYVTADLSLKDTWIKRNIVSSIQTRLRLNSLLTHRIWSAALIPMGLIFYLLYTQLTTGDWYMVFSDMSIWGRDKFTFPLQVFFRYAKMFLSVSAHTLVYWIAVLELSGAVGMIFLLLRSYKRTRLSYFVLFCLSVLIPMSTGTFQGMPRYGLHIIPFFYALVDYVSSRSYPMQILIITFFIVLQIVLVSMFTRGYFVA